eukprot:TRINITY_DN27992_c0_g1_i1.p1 TRINITY_DN27992_c0_g1~~TRINITY_DN27992_c0_g1_i1.p1  ORF type:complete len:137 (+),score=19.51 TRINITY_DN27992_c0_g1_i1:353-763(+)
MAAIIRPFVEIDSTKMVSLFDFDVDTNVSSDPLNNSDVLVMTKGGRGGLALGRFLQVRPAVLSAEIAAHRAGKVLATERQGECVSLPPSEVKVADGQLGAADDPACLNTDIASNAVLCRVTVMYLVWLVNALVLAQ